MKAPTKKLKIYEFLFKRIPFTECDEQHFKHLKTIETLDLKFETMLNEIDCTHITTTWHYTFQSDDSLPPVNVLLKTNTTYYLFYLHDFKGKHYLNVFNILIDQNDTPTYDINRTDIIYNAFKNDCFLNDSFQLPIIVKHVMMNPSFQLVNTPSNVIIEIQHIPQYLKAIERESQLHTHKNTTLSH